MQPPRTSLTLLFIRHRLFRHNHTFRHPPTTTTTKNDTNKPAAKTKPENNHKESDYITLNKNKGQHLLVNQRILNSIVEKSNINPTDTVLEIGPGTGNLTMKLLRVCKSVVAVEVDRRMVQAVSNRAADEGLRHKLNVICEDALKAKLPKYDLIVANIPYNISSPLIARIVFNGNFYRSATLLLQKEFARRLLANPGDSEYNRLAVNVKLVADVEFLMDVSKREFVPCPKVDSSVVIIRPKAEIPNVDFLEWFAFTKTCFNTKNKTLGAILKQKKKLLELLQISRGTNHHLDNYNEYFDEEDTESGVQVGCSTAELEMGTSIFKEKIMEILTTVGYHDKRPAKISSQELLNLLREFNHAGIYFHGHYRLSDSTHKCHLKS